MKDPTLLNYTLVNTLICSYMTHELLLEIHICAVNNLCLVNRRKIIKRICAHTLKIKVICNVFSDYMIFYSRCDRVQYLTFLNNKL